MSTVEDRITFLKTEFRKELRHLTTETDLDHGDECRAV